MPTTDRDNTLFLAALASASRTLGIIAVDDICDVRGIKLVCAGQHLSAETQAKLVERTLAKPLELSVRVDGGVTRAEIAHLATSMCQGSAFLAALVGNDFATLKREFLALSLRPFVHVLLSVQRATRPEQFAHAVLCSLIAGTFACKSGAPETTPQFALVAGLTHDLGEGYRRPNDCTLIAGPARDRWRDVVEHVAIGRHLIEQFTDYPAPIARAIFEHHERLDGSGYPCGISGDAISPLGRVLGLADTICGIVHAPDNHGARAKLALSFVPGEFDPQLVRLLAEATRGTIAAEIALPVSFDLTVAIDHAKTMSQCLERARQEIEKLATANQVDEKMTKIVAFTAHRIDRLKSAWDATGIDAYCVAESSHGAASQVDEESYFDLDVVSRELTWRMRSLSRQIVHLLHQYRIDGYGVLEPVIAALELGD